MAIAVSKLAIECKRVKEKLTIVDESTLNYGNSLVAPVIEYISLHLDDNELLGEENLAKIISVSVSTLRRAFKNDTAFNPKEFIIRSRMAYAEHLLRATNISVLEISTRVGYNEISGFNRVFKEYFNLSPTIYRKKFKTPL